jgi:hypothetical protein
MYELIQTCLNLREASPVQNQIFLFITNLHAYTSTEFCLLDDSTFDLTFFTYSIYNKCKW